MESFGGQLDVSTITGFIDGGGNVLVAGASNIGGKVPFCVVRWGVWPPNGGDGGLFSICDWNLKLASRSYANNANDETDDLHCGYPMYSLMR